jgi:Enoyl-(Acyl carrier protein) reductase
MSRVSQSACIRDFAVNAIAFAPADDLHGRVVDCSAAGFTMAMDVSCHSFLSMARLAEPLMKAGGCLLTVTFYGSERVVAHYNLMGPGEGGVGKRGPVYRGRTRPEGNPRARDLAWAHPYPSRRRNRPLR